MSAGKVKEHGTIPVARQLAAWAVGLLPGRVVTPHRTGGPGVFPGRHPSRPAGREA